MNDLFDGIDDAPATESLADGAVLLRGFARAEATVLVACIDAIAVAAPFRHMTTPGGRTMSAAMTNCGTVGWTSDRRGYRYTAHDPQTGAPWPALPAAFIALADRAAGSAGFVGFAPDSCLVNRYAPGSRLTLHRDCNECDFAAPIVSVSLGLPAVFMFGGSRRTDRVKRVRLVHGDVAVWGGPARLAHHGIAPLAGGVHPLTGATRYNLTFRKAL